MYDDYGRLELRYDQLLSGVAGTLRKDGNIAQVISRVRGRERQAYSPTYDYLGRMLTASYYDVTDGGTVSSAYSGVFDPPIPGYCPPCG